MTQADTATSATPFPWAARTSARSKPKVWLDVGVHAESYSGRVGARETRLEAR